MASSTILATKTKLIDDAFRIESQWGTSAWYNDRRRLDAANNREWIPKRDKIV
jgi:hypothetical protein